MYPSTTFYIEDRSQITDLQINEQINAPLFMQFFTADKGPEEIGEYYGEHFAKMFGRPNFARHGQPLLQAQRLINNGARVLAKRVVAPDATLANTVVLAHVKKVTTQKTDAEGNGLYIDADGNETTIENDNPVVETKCEINYTLESISDNYNDIEDLKESALALANYEDKAEDDVKIYPICLVADNGRGVSSKKFKIEANIKGSRTSEYLSYVFTVLEDSSRVESVVFTLNPDISSVTSNLSLTSVARTHLKSVRAFSFDDVMIDFIENIKSITKLEDIDNVDILFGNNKKGYPLEQFAVNTETDWTKNLAMPTGHALEAGDNGSFGNYPIRSADYAKAMVEAFDGTYSNDVFDYTNIQLDAIIDANYPEEVKKVIEKLIEFRQDAFYFRDLGTGLYTLEDIIVKADLAAKNRYVGIYCNSYDVIDDYTKKQITVTTGYTLAKLLPKHFSDRRHSPVAGQLYDFIFDEIVEGTVNFLPKHIPENVARNIKEINQKEELFDRHINFISYLDRIPTLESEYTSQEAHTGFSYINNTLAVQELVKTIRSRCPKTRYSFMEPDDLIKYQEDVQLVLNKYKSNFGTLEMKYMADPAYEQNMAYYAVLWVRFKKFVQAEVFRIIAINDDDQITEI